MTTTPQHIAIIMDGNGRWAKQRFLPRIAGHKAGVDAAKKIIKFCSNHGIKVLTLFAFSNENWRRPLLEVSYLMDLLLAVLEHEARDMHKNNMRLRFIGRRDNFNPKLFAKIIEVEKLTEKNTGMVLLIAADYGGQWDICQAIQSVAHEIETGVRTSKEINPDVISAKLSFADLPNPDLFIRTSGELRLSNFMLWQLAYTELYFTPVLWPDFDESELEKAITHYQLRERRFGYSSDQIGETAGKSHA